MPPFLIRMLRGFWKQYAMYYNKKLAKRNSTIKIVPLEIDLSKFAIQPLWWHWRPPSRQGLLLAWSSPINRTWQASKVPMTLFVSPTLRLQWYTTSGFLHLCYRTNPRPSTCTSSTLPTEPSFMPCIFILKQNLWIFVIYDRLTSDSKLTSI